jgi:hypothetical protein
MEVGESEVSRRRRCVQDVSAVGCRRAVATMGCGWGGRGGEVRKTGRGCGGAAMCGEGGGVSSTSIKSTMRTSAPATPSNAPADETTGAVSVIRYPRPKRSRYGAETVDGGVGRKEARERGVSRPGVEEAEATASV